MKESFGLKRIGPYEVVEFLGRGGMGVVFLGKHRDSGELVALKTVKIPTASNLRTLQQEFRALRVLRHPGVVRAFDDGVEGAVPWFAMELLKGRTLLQHIVKPAGVDASTDGSLGLETRQLSGASWTHHPSRLDAFDDLTRSSVSDPVREKVESVSGSKLGVCMLRSLGWMKQVCQALAYVHGEGVAHLDLKPENILITEQGRAVLLDFGLALRFPHRISPMLLENAGLFAGTVAYISPERARGEEPDVRADLYAVGCILYQMVTGRLPFVDGDLAQVARQHVVALPIPPSRLGIRIPDELERLILSLLAKQPHKRPPHAGVIARVLAELGVDGDFEDAPPARLHLYRSELVGHEAIITRLSQHLESALEARGQAVALQGESGVGKSKLASELIRQARQRGARVVINRCQVPTAGHNSALVGAPLHAFHGLFQFVAAQCLDPSSNAKQELARPIALLAPYAPILEPFADQTKAAAAPQRPEAARAFELFEALAQICVWLTDEPTVFVFEDIQWADPTSLDALVFVLGCVEQSRCLLVCTCQSEGRTLEVDALLDRPEIERLEVPRLSHEAIATIIRRMMNTSTPPERLLQAVVAAADGNPLSAVETLHLTLDQGGVHLTDEGQWRVDVL